MKKQLLFGLLCMGCQPHDDFFSDDGFGVDAAHCLDIETGVVDFGEFLVDDVPDAQVVYVDNLCGEETSNITFSLDDPAGVFLMQVNQEGETLAVTITTRILESGDWEAQVIINEPFADKKHYVQLFATSRTDDTSE